MPNFGDLQDVNQSVAGVRLSTRRGPIEGDGVTHIGHKARHQCFLEHCIPVHVSQVGHALDVTKAGQAALGVLGQQLQSEGKGTVGMVHPKRMIMGLEYITSLNT